MGQIRSREEWDTLDAAVVAGVGDAVAGAPVALAPVNPGGKLGADPNVLPAVGEWASLRKRCAARRGAWMWEVAPLVIREGLPVNRAIRTLRERSGKGDSREYYRALKRWPKLRAKHEQALEILAAEYAETSLDAVEHAVRYAEDVRNEPKRAMAVVQASRELSARRAWMAGQLNPDQWGESVRHTGVVRTEAVVMLPQLAPLLPPAEATATATLADVSAALIGG